MSPVAVVNEEGIMPNYDFQCPACGRVFEENLLIAERDRKDVACPDCGHEGARRRISAPHIGGGGGGAPTRFVPT